jgi:hypothetical protein
MGLEATEGLDPVEKGKAPAEGKPQLPAPAAGT